MRNKNCLSIEFLCQCLREEEGRVFWLVRPREHFKSETGWKTWNKRFAGKEAGYLNRRKNGDARWMVCIEFSMFLRYQVIWAMTHGEWADRLDHKNRNSLDDRVENLRPATQSQNIANSRCNSSNTSGFKGVQWRKKTQKWCAVIRVQYKNIYLGQYETREEAHAAYLDAAKKNFGEFACGG